MSMRTGHNVEETPANVPPICDVPGRQRASVHPGRPCILLVDDEVRNRKLLRSILEAEGYQVLEADGGIRALTILAQRPVDLILCDIMMPDIDGIEVTRRLKGLEDYAHIPIIIITALQDHDTRHAALAAGAEDFLSRPVDRIELCTRVRNLCRLKALADTIRLHNFQLEELVAQRTEKLRKSEDFLYHILDALPVHIAILDHTKRLVRVNRAWRQFAEANGGSCEAYVGMPYLSQETLATSAEACQFDAGIDRVLRAEEVCYEQEYACHSPETQRWFLGRVTRFLLPEGPYALIAHMDITAQKQAEEQLRQAQKMEAVGRLAAGVAHDFNNLLVSIIGFSGFVRDSLASGDPRREDIRQVLAAADRAAGLTRQLLMFSRQQPIESHPFDLNETLANIARLLHRTIGEDILLHIEGAAEPMMVYGDSTQMDQVLLNLAVNARDAMPQGGELRISLAPAALEPSAATSQGRAGRMVQLRIRDTGSGMDEATQQRIFEPFFTTKEPGRGTGLGLATCYGIVTQMGGTIAVMSTPGHGTTFVIHLPCCDGGEAAPSAMPPSNQAFRGYETILVVEDEPGARRVAQRLLEEHGYRVHLAQDTVEAQEVLDTAGGSIDLVLSDIVLPRGNGYDLARQLRDLYPGLPVILTSGYTDRAQANAAASVDGAILWKPYTPDTLLLRVRAALDSQHARNGVALRPTRAGGASVLVVEDEEHVRAALRRVLEQHGYAVILCDAVGAARRLLADGAAVDVVLCDMQLGNESGLDLLAWLTVARPALALRTLFVTGQSDTSLHRDLAERLVHKPVHVRDLLWRVETVLSQAAGQATTASCQGGERP